MQHAAGRTTHTTSEPPAAPLRAATLLAVAGLATATLAGPIDFSWNAGNGLWTNANNWTPNRVPGNPPIGEDHFVHIGDLGGVQNGTVLLEWPGPPTLVYVNGLSLSNGMTLDTNGNQLGTFGAVSLTGAGTRLVVRHSTAPLNEYDVLGQLQLGAGGSMELHDDSLVGLASGSFSSGEISGRGTIRVGDFRNGGTIRPSPNGGISLVQGNADLMDLDGLSGNGQLSLITPFSQLSAEGVALHDSFSGAISVVPGALLNMNFDEGWEADAACVLNVAGFNNPAAASQINGSAMSFGGTMNVGAAEGHLRVLAPLTLQPSATVNIGDTDWVEFDGATTVLGGQYNLGAGGRLDFDGPASIRGGEFNTAGATLADGGVFFNGPTEWRGTTTINGAARQNGDATVSTPLGAVINAAKFDMDGESQHTHWDIHSGLVINAETISGNDANGFNGSMDIGGGFLSKLTVNLSEGAWNNLGETTLAGDQSLYLTRIAGSGMQLFGDLTVASGRVRIDAALLVASPSSVTFGQPSAALMTTGHTWVQSQAEFNGSGTLRNGPTGDMVFSDGVSLGGVGFQNDGLFEIGLGDGTISSGEAFVNWFDTTPTATWTVSLGGYLPGEEHDRLTVPTGAATLDGTIGVILADLGAGRFRPHIGDEFMILSAFGGVNGSFTNDPVTLAGGVTYEWSVLYNSSSVVLRLDNVLPSPGSMALLGAAGLIAIRRTRR